MMSKKAETFNDDETLGKILSAATPAKAKALGRRVQGFSDVVWDTVKEKVVFEGLIVHVRFLLCIF
jgi:hypothetical protein